MLSKCVNFYHKQSYSETVVGKRYEGDAILLQTQAFIQNAQLYTGGCEKNEHSTCIHRRSGLSHLPRGHKRLTKHFLAVEQDKHRPHKTMRQK